MENTLENKEKFLFQYYGQQCFKVTVDAIVNQKVTGFFVERFGETGFLELKPISSITDEDAIEVFNMALRYRHDAIHRLTEKDFIKQGKRFAEDLQYINGGYIVGLLGVLSSIDYLRSKKYALPYNGLSVEEQVKRNWIKLIQ